MSLYRYIHEYDDYDAAMLATHNLMKESAVAMFEYEQAERLATKKVMFENANYDVFMEEAKDNFFVRIGKALTTMITKIGEFLKGIFDKVFNREKNKEREKNVAIAKDIIAKHPELKNQVISDLQEGKVDLKDAAQYSRDIESVLKLAERQDAEADTINNKVNDVCDKIEKAPAIRVAATLGTIAGALGGVFALYKGLGTLTDSIQHIKSSAEGRKEAIAKGREIHSQITHYNRNSPSDPRERAIAKDSIRRNIDEMEQIKAYKVENARMNGFSKLLHSLMPAAKEYSKIVNVTDRAIERFNKTCAGEEFDKHNRPRPTRNNPSAQNP